MHDNSLHQRLKTVPPITTGLLFTPPAWPCPRTPTSPDCALRSTTPRHADDTSVHAGAGDLRGDGAVEYPADHNHPQAA